VADVLRRAEADTPGQRIQPAGAVALVESPHLGRLVSLDLSRNRIGSADAAALARGACFSLLTSLDLRQNNLCAEGVAVLLQSPDLARCKVET
jgi:hypothetical protein